MGGWVSRCVGGGGWGGEWWLGSGDAESGRGKWGGWARVAAGRGKRPLLRCLLRPPPAARRARAGCCASLPARPCGLWSGPSQPLARPQWPYRLHPGCTSWSGDWLRLSEMSVGERFQRSRGELAMQRAAPSVGARVRGVDPRRHRRDRLGFAGVGTAGGPIRRGGLWDSRSPTELLRRKLTSSKN